MQKESTYQFLSQLALLRDEHRKLKAQSEIPGLTSEDRIGMIMETDQIGKKMVEAILQWEPE